MATAMLASRRSKDPSTQVGACIVSPENIIAGVGYNGMPRGCDDDDFPWGRDGAPLDTKYLYVVHAEENAFTNTSALDLRGFRLYVALFPCNNCAKTIIQKGIGEIIYLSDKYAELDEYKASRRMLAAAGVVFRQYSGRMSIIDTIASL